MPQSRSYTTEAIVIRHMDYGEADSIVTLYTMTSGKVSAIAKGARRPRSRNVGHMELFSRLTVLLARGRNLDIVSQSQGVEQFAALRGDLMLTGYAHYVSELLDHFAPDDIANPRLYGAYLDTLRRIDTGNTGLNIRAYEMAILEASGYRPELRQCIECANQIRPGENRLSIELGGVLCPNCIHTDVAAVHISNEALKILRNLQIHPDRVLALQSVHTGTLREIESRLDQYITYRLERRTKTPAVLNTFRRHLAASQA